MSQGIIDNFGRPITYLRMAVTDRCNLRCYYCMPAEGINYLPKKELLTYEEMLKLAQVFCEMGVNKIRITGGEPFVRRDLMSFLRQLSETAGLNELHITTNGVLTAQYIDELKALGIASINLSLDSLNPERFFKITRRDVFTQVEETLNKLLDSGIDTKINMVVMDGQNEDDIIPMADLTKDKPLSIRYIEEMPFNGNGHNSIKWNHREILNTLNTHYGSLTKLQDPQFSTSSNYQIPGYQGNIGIIAAYTRTFCGSCNRIRLTSEGNIKTCLYDQTQLDLKAILRSGGSDLELKQAITHALTHRHKDGHAAEAARSTNVEESMSTIGG
ncbi:GTP 3',8-cyclase MoaA [Fulvivirga ligni]|uniref:GTP 3',8-cyclase MoaA n=1 Tax=Fulvivirga ligni TaxID=2904246 RepID=UPI001F4041AD|nr:GTP 3',8-cyclase MoaA [Fulvivirga ligni]UII23809.1 GTP 3',8-cyclase MoaA [Fulvivirga ligni]